MNKTIVLVVDDEKGIRDGSERVLIKMGCEVLKASNGEKGLEILKNKKVSIILLDLKMPGIDGMEMLKKVREIDETIMIIVITGFATVATAIEAMKRGAYDFIPKPFEPDQLRIVVGRAMEKLRLIRETKKLENDRKKNLADLDTEKSRIYTIVESLPNGVMVTNTTGNVVLMNPVFLRHLEINPEIGTGKPIETYVKDNKFCSFVMEISEGKYMDSDKIPTYEFATKEDKYLMARGKPVLGDQNECLGAVISIVDVTTIKMLDQLKSEFVAKVSHELRSPLSTIHEQLAFVLSDMVGENSVKDHHLISRAKEKTKGLIALIGDLLDLSRIEEGTVFKNQKPVRIEELLESIVTFMDSSIKRKKQSLLIKFPEFSLPTFTTDPMALESIFGNLITNAVNYTPEGGKIFVSANLSDNYIVVSVEDNGFGIKPDHQKNIFKKFYRVKDEKTRHITGTGLGLPIVKGLIDDLGGTIKLESEYGKGSTFAVFLPLNQLPEQTDI